MVVEWFLCKKYYGCWRGVNMMVTFDENVVTHDNRNNVESRSSKLPSEIGKWYNIMAIGTEITEVSQSLKRIYSCEICLFFRSLDDIYLYYC